MTKNIYRDGLPGNDVYATCAKSPNGVYGVVLAFGDLQLLFVPEDSLTSYLAAATTTFGADHECLNLIRDAAKSLEQFKRNSQKIHAAAMN